MEETSHIIDRKRMRSQTLDLLRFPLAVVVLLIHTFGVEGLGVNGRAFESEQYPLFVVVRDAIEAFLGGQSVPVYFFISGYVFFLGVEWTRATYARKLKNRLHTLLIPYVLWNTIALMLLAVRLLPCFRSYLSQPEGAGELTLANVLSCYWVYNGGLNGVEMDTTVPIDFPLWFVRDLMVVVLCTPLLYRVLRIAGRYAVWLLGLLWFGLGYVDAGHFYLFVTAFFFFSWGAYMSIGRRDMLSEFGRRFKVSVVLYPLLGLGCMLVAHRSPEAYATFKNLNIVVGLFFAYDVAAWLLRRGWCRVSPFLASSSFFIYVSHTLVCSRLTKVLLVVFQPSSGVGTVAVYALSAAATVGLLLACFYVLRRYAPAVLRVLVGRGSRPAVSGPALPA